MSFPAAGSTAKRKGQVKVVYDVEMSNYTAKTCVFELCLCRRKILLLYIIIIIIIIRETSGRIWRKDVASLLFAKPLRLCGMTDTRRHIQVLYYSDSKGKTLFYQPALVC